MFSFFIGNFFFSFSSYFPAEKIRRYRAGSSSTPICSVPQPQHHQDLLVKLSLEGERDVGLMAAVICPFAQRAP